MDITPYVLDLDILESLNRHNIRTVCPDDAVTEVLSNNRIDIFYTLLKIYGNININTRIPNMSLETYLLVTEIRGRIFDEEYLLCDAINNNNRPLFEHLAYDHMQSAVAMASKKGHVHVLNWLKLMGMGHVQDIVSHPFVVEWWCAIGINNTIVEMKSIIKTKAYHLLEHVGDKFVLEIGDLTRYSDYTVMKWLQNNPQVHNGDVKSYMFKMSCPIFNRDSIINNPLSSKEDLLTVCRRGVITSSVINCPINNINVIIEATSITVWSTSSVQNLEKLRKLGARFTLPPLEMDDITNIKLLDWILEVGTMQPTYSTRAMDNATRCGNVNLLEWWKNSGLELMYTTSASHVYPNSLKWWIASGLPVRCVTGDLFRYSTHAIVDMIKFGMSIEQTFRVKVIQLELFGIVDMDDEHLMDIASAAGNVELLERCKMEGRKYSTDSIDYASGNAQLKSLEWWVKSGLVMKYSHLAFDKLDRYDWTTPSFMPRILQWWSESGLELKPRFLTNTTNYILYNWCVEMDLVSSLNITTLINSGNINYIKSLPIDTYAQRIHDAASLLDNAELLHWLVECGHISMEDIEETNPSCLTI